MKKFSFLALAAAGMLLAACSSDKDVEAPKLNQYDMVEGQNAWISVGIALPGDAGTRNNHDLNDGLATEFEVKSGKIVLFKGASEDEATLVKAYDLTATFSGEEGDNVPQGNSEGTTPAGFGEVTSTSTKIVQEIDAPSLGAEDNLYAYVILNDADNLTNIAYTPGAKFSAFKVQVLQAIGINAEVKGYGAIGEHGLVMTSVPIADKPGGAAAPAADTKVTTLAKIQKEAIYTTKAAAEAGTAMACIYVERAAVKVEVMKADGLTQIELPDGEKIDFTFDGWALGNTNNSASGYYNTRQFENEWMPYFNAQCQTNYLKYRMVGSTLFFDDGHTTAYRTYFGRDVNYDGKTGLVNSKIGLNDYVLGNGAVTYTYENTFDENSQKWENTTYVGFKVTVAGGDFWTMEGQRNTRLTEDDLPGAVAKNAVATINNAITTIRNAIKADLEGSNTIGLALDPIPNVTFSVVPVVTLGAYDATTGEQAYSYKLDVTNLKNGDTDFTSAQVNAVKALTDVAAVLAADHTVDVKLYKYVGGVTYYSARIAHFGDVETPWDAPNEAYNIYDKIYPMDGKSIHDTPIDFGASRAAAWLGRWGVVRNNWYRLTINKIEGLGSPVPEEYDGDVTPDDNPNPKYYISAHVHILPWAVRKQSVNLQ